MAASLSTLIALSNSEVRGILSFAIEGRTGEKPFEAGSAKQAIEALADHGAIRIVICEYPGISDVLFRHIVSLNRARPEKDQIRCIVCAARKPEDDAIVQKMNILGYASFVNLIDSTLSLLQPLFASETDVPMPETDRELNDDTIVRIKTTLLIRVGQLRAGVYIRLSPTKVVKLFQEGDEFEEADYTRMLNEKKTEYLYLRKDEVGEFVEKFKSDLLILLQAELQPEQAGSKLLEEIHETAQELLNKLGPTKEVQEVVKASVNLALKTMGSHPRLADLLAKLQIDRDKYISSHSMLLPQIACALAIAMGWKSEATLQKLGLVAFLHDTTLTNQALAAVTSLTELSRKSDQFSEAEIKLYREHPVKTSEMAKRFHEVPPDVDTIILQHHERPDGSGFPRALTHTHISPLGAVFIVAHDLVSAIFDPSKPFVLEEFIESKKKEYYVGNFKKLHGHLANLKL